MIFTMSGALLEGVRVVEVAMFAPDATGMHLADLGADVIKVEQPGLGDPARQLGVPFRGESPATRRWNRGKRSIALDLRSDAGKEAFRDLVACSEVVVQGMRPGALARRGLGYDELLAVNPALVFAAVSGWGEAGPYRDLGSHGLAFDAFAGLAPPREVDGRPARPAGHVWQGLEAAPLYAALAIVAAVLRARTTGEPCRLEISEADAAATWNMWRIAYEAANAHVQSVRRRRHRTGSCPRSNAAAEGAGRTGADDPPGADVRYQYYATSDGYVLLMATETRFWENFCRAVGRMDLFEQWPGKRPVDHDYGNDTLREELARIFAARTRAEWVQLFIDADVAGAPVYLPGETHLDPHFAARGLWLDAEVHGVSLLAPPVRADGAIAVSGRAARQHAADQDQVLRDVLGYDDARVEALRVAGAFGGDT